MNSVKEIDIKNRTQFFLGDMINIESLDPGKIKIDEKSYKNFLPHWIRDGQRPYATANSVNPFY